MVAYLPIAALGAVHENANTLAEDINGGGTAILAWLHRGGSEEEYLRLIAVKWRGTREQVLVFVQKSSEFRISIRLLCQDLL